jgi:hypothetical protein
VTLVVDPALAAAVSAAWPGPAPLGRGLGAAAAGGRGACVVVTDRPLTEAEATAVAVAAATALGVGGPVEVAALHAAAGTPLVDLVRQWVNQAAQGSGRGVRVRLAGPPGAEPAPGEPVRVLVEAIDSSARELALRLASPWEPALPALRALLAAEVTVEDAETAER